MEKTVRAVLYARFSSELQRTESIDAQIRAMKQYCKEQHWEVVGTYVDEALSGTTDRRPSFQMMIADSEKKKFDIVLVHKLDRFCRNRYDSANYKYILRKNGVKLCSVLEKLDGSPESIILEGLLEAMAEYYSSNLAREVMKGLKENAYHCKHTGGSPPLGYDLDEDKRMIINPKETECVRMIFWMYINGYGRTEMASILNKNGYVNKRGKPFTKDSFLSILIPQN